MFIYSIIGVEFFVICFVWMLLVSWFVKGNINWKYYRKYIY